jgi:hypothetical protein
LAPCSDRHLQAAEALDIAVPAALRARADEVIE